MYGKRQIVAINEDLRFDSQNIELNSKFSDLSEVTNFGEMLIFYISIYFYIHVAWFDLNFWLDVEKL